jgi:hypothetical protein
MAQRRNDATLIFLRAAIAFARVGAVHRCASHAAWLRDRSRDCRHARMARVQRSAALQLSTGYSACLRNGLVGAFVVGACWLRRRAAIRANDMTRFTGVIVPAVGGTDLDF